MFETLTSPAPDKILALIALLRDDPRQHKVDLGVGVYKDREGRTPIMQSVRDAEQVLFAEQTTKTYLGLAGDTTFDTKMTELVLGDAAPAARVRAIQAPGGSGALRILLELLRRARPDATVWVSDPTWPNHIPMIEASGLKHVSYPYFDATTGTVRFEAMLAALAQAKPDDVVLLHGCCHNPTGANLTLDQWREIGKLIVEKRLFPFVDIAYQGFDRDIELDASVVRRFAATPGPLFVSNSFSKSFSLYGERIGALTVVATDKDEAARALSQLKRVVRANYSTPPTHGAQIIAMILGNPESSALWNMELAGMRERIRDMRKALVDKLAKYAPDVDFRFILEQRGMFSYTGLTAAQVERLRTEFSVYAVDTGRICVAALNSRNVDYTAKAIAALVAA